MGKITCNKRAGIVFTLAQRPVWCNFLRRRILPLPGVLNSTGQAIRRGKPMSLPLHQVCLPPLRQTLQSLSNELTMASEHFAASGVDESAFLQARLAPDMYPFIQQIHAMTDHARRVVALLADIEMPEIAADETDLAGLRKRIAASLDFIESVDTNAIDAGEQRALAVSNRVGVLNMAGWEYTLRVAFPHFFFHATTAHDLIRQAGVDVGKRHFLGSVFAERLTPHAANA
jgi:uncharacterized protein